MYRLLIADDEPLEREGLEWIARSAMPGAFRIIHADSGRAAIALAEEHRPHIVFMDINMPGIQGLAALRQIKTMLPDVQMVLVTAYDYFSYAQEAISLGVKEFLVKPASRERIEETLRRMVAQVEQDKARREQELELLHKVSQLEPMVENELAFTIMANPVQAKDVDTLTEWLSFPLDRGCALIAAFPKQAYEFESKSIYDSVRSFAKASSLPCIVGSLIDWHMTVFFRFPSEETSKGWKEELRTFGARLNEFLLRQYGFSASVGVGAPQREAEGFRTSYFEAVFASTFVGDAGGVQLFDEVVQPGERPPEELAQSAGQDAERRSYVVNALQRIRDERERRTVTVLDRAKEYIAERFTSDISLEDAAGFVHLHPQYFSKLFKQQTGESFTDFVTRLRIEKAKELIASGELSLKEVCYEVGYKDPNYFSRVFKKVTGSTPSEYKGTVVQP